MSAATERKLQCISENDILSCHSTRFLFFLFNLSERGHRFLFHFSDFVKRLNAEKYSHLLISLAVHGGEHLYNQALIIPEPI